MSGKSGCRWNPQRLRSDLGRSRREEANQPGRSFSPCRSVITGVKWNSTLLAKKCFSLQKQPKEPWIIMPELYQETWLMFDSHSEIWDPPLPPFVSKVPWHGTGSSCRQEVETEWSSSGMSEPPLLRRGGCKVTGKKCVVSNGHLTTSISRPEETTTRWENILKLTQTKLNNKPLQSLLGQCRRVKWKESTTCFLSSRSAVGVEQLQSAPSAAVQWPPGSSEGHCLVPTPTRAAGVGRRHRWPLPALLEHTDGSGTAEHRHWLPGLQPGMVQTRQWTGEKACTHSLSHTHTQIVITPSHKNGNAHPISKILQKCIT